MQEILIEIFDKPLGIILAQLISATRFTIYLSLIAFVGGGLLALIITFLRIYPSKIFNYISFSYVWLFQSLPLLMLLFIIGLGIPRFIGQEFDPWYAASISLIVFTSAYLSEVWRGAILAIPKGQWEAAHSLGFGNILTMRLVILPQAMRVIVPPLTSQMLNLTKNSSLAVAIGYPDFVSISQTTLNQTGQAIEPIGLIIVVYLYLLRVQ